MTSLLVNEMFASLSGEISMVAHAGTKTYIVRFAGCNLRCPYCDAKSAQKTDYSVPLTNFTTQGLIEHLTATINVMRFQHLLFTGGEPLLQQEELSKICEALLHTYPSLRITIETNGTVELLPSMFCDNRICLVVDIKTDECCNTDPSNNNKGVSLINLARFAVASDCLSPSLRAGISFNLMYKIVVGSIKEMNWGIMKVIELHNVLQKVTGMQAIPSIPVFFSPQTEVQSGHVIMDTAVVNALRMICFENNPFHDTMAQNVAVGLNFQLHKLLAFR